MRLESKKLMFLAVKSLQFKKKKCKKKRRLLLKIFSERSALPRKRFLTLIIHIAALQINVREPRKIWAYEREEFWFSRMSNDQRFSDFWSQDFRMKEETFDEIVQVVRPAVEKRDTQLRRAIPIEKRVRVAIWRLAARGGFRVQKKVVTNFCKIDTIYIKVIALIFVVIVVVIIIIADVAILLCFEILVVTA